MQRQIILILLLTFTIFFPAWAARPPIVELDSIVAVVNKEVITSGELDKRITLVKKQIKNNVSLPADSVLRRQILERLIMEELQLQSAKQSSIRIDDEQLTQVIRNIAQDNKLSLEQFTEVLQRDGVSFAEFREQIRNEMMVNQLRRTRVDNAISISEQEVDNLLSRQGDAQTENEYHLLHILIALPEGASPETIDATASKAEQIARKIQGGADFAQTALAVSDSPTALQGGDLGWLREAQIPTVLADIVPKMSAKQFAGPIRSTNGFHIVKLLETRSQEIKHVVEQSLARHILIKTDTVTTNEVARERLERIRQRIVSGEDFAALARATSMDTGSAADGGNLGWVSPGVMVTEFETAMLKLKAGDISEPFQSRFGWHIVQVLSRRTHDDTRDYVRNRARQVILQRKTAEETENWLRRLRAEAYVEIRLAE